MADPIWKLLEKEYGKGLVVSGDAIIEEPHKIISWGPALDSITGGVPEGSWVICTGPPKFGKTTALLTLAAQAQKEGYFVVYLNVEGRLKPMNMIGIKGLLTDEEHFHVIKSTEEKILSAQDYLNMASKILNAMKKVFLIVDSWSALTHQKELEEGVGTSTRGGTNVLLSQFSNQLCNVVPVKKHIVAGVTHLMANTSGYGASTIEKGGFRINYGYDVKIKAKSRKYIEDSKGKNIGQMVEWVSESNALGPPGGTINGYIRYGVGVDFLLESIVQATELNIIVKSGSWYECEKIKDENEKSLRAQGQEKLYTLFSENEKYQTQLLEELKKYR